MILTRNLALAFVAIGFAVVAVGGFYALQLGTPGGVTREEIIKLTWEKTGGFVGIDEELVVEADGSTKFSSNLFDDSVACQKEIRTVCMRLDESELLDLMKAANFFSSDIIYNTRPGAADFFTYRITLVTSSDPKMVEWVDDWASAESLPADLVDLQLHMESIIERMRQHAGGSEEANERAIRIAERFILQAPTFKFDGIRETLEVGDVIVLEIFPPQYKITITFDSSHAGYGDRAGQFLLQVITHHEARITVARDNVVSAIMDDRWDELNQELYATRPPPPSGPLPQIVLRYGGASYEGLQGSYCWGEVCVDYVPLELRENLDSVTSIEVTNGSQVNFAIRGYEEPEKYHVRIYSLTQETYVWNREVEGALTLDLPSGTYFLTVSASWISGGDASNIFKLEVE